MCCGEGSREGRACWAEGTVVTKVSMKAFVEKNEKSNNMSR